MHYTSKVFRITMEYVKYWISMIWLIIWTRCLACWIINYYNQSYLHKIGSQMCHCNSKWDCRSVITQGSVYMLSQREHTIYHSKKDQTVAKSDRKSELYLVSPRLTLSKNRPIKVTQCGQESIYIWYSKRHLTPCLRCRHHLLPQNHSNKYSASYQGLICCG